MKQSDWISVKDKLPSLDEVVIVCREINDVVFVDIGTYIGRGKNGQNPSFFFERSGLDKSVTHWQPIVLPKKK